MTNKLLILFTLILTVTANGFAAGNSPGATAAGWCATKNPDKAWEGKFQKKIADFKSQQSQQKTTQATMYIPVIVHVVYYNNNTAQNITKAQVDSQINILNRDYAGQSQFIGNVPAPFKPLIANTNIQWCAAKVDQNGAVLAEPGIDRVNGKIAPYSFINPGLAGWAREYIDTLVKPKTVWNPRFYCNIWVVPSMQGGIIGYATFPTLTTLDGIGDGTATDATDGVVIAAFAYGKGGSTISPYNSGGTAAHELGHWLGLRHISGDEACSVDNDFVADTPPQSGGNAGGQNGLNYGCATYPYHPNGCNGLTGAAGEMYMNYMDYSDDNCTNMFSLGQKDRMVTAMNNGDHRLPLLTSPVCDASMPQPVADFSYAPLSAALCTASKTYNFTDKSLFGPTAWAWSFAGGTPATSNIKNPTGIVFSTPGLHTVSLTITNSMGTSTVTKSVNVTLIGTNTLPLVENFESNTFPPVGWNLVNRNGNPAVNWDVIDGYSAYGVGTRSMIYDNTNLDAGGKKDDIVSPKLDLTGITTAKLKFDVAYAPYYDSTPPPSSIFDTLEVYITDNCEGTVQRIYTKGGTALATFLPGIGTEFYPTAGQWRTDSIVIPPAYQNKPNIQIIFRNLGNYGHTIYVDNINLAAQSSTPTATANFNVSDTTVCPGGSLTFTNTSTASTGTPDSVRWTIPGGTPSTSTSITTVSPVFNTTGTYVISLVAYKSGTPSPAITKSIRVKAKPVVAVNSPTICSGASTLLTATGAAAYSWNTVPAQTGTSITVSPTSTTSYIVTETSSGCSSTATSTVTVNQLPTVSANSPTICAGQNASLTATGTGTSYSWNTVPVQTGTNISVSPSTTTTYIVTATSAASCISTATATVTVNQLPTLTVNSPSICSGQSTTLTATGNGTSFSWNTVPVQTTASISVSPTATTSYTVTAYSAASCSKTATATVTVSSAAPTVVINPNPASVCLGDAITLKASGANSYVWDQPGGTGDSITLSPLSDLTVGVSGTLTGCTTAGTSSVTITVKPKPTVAVNSPSICSGQSASLTATGANTYTWTGGLTSVFNPTTPVLSSSTSYVVTGTAANGCKNTATASVTVSQSPPTALATTSNAICNGASVTLTASGANSYTWLPSGSGPSQVVSPASTVTYTVTGSNGSTCTSTASQTITVTDIPGTPAITQSNDTLYSSVIVAGANYKWYLNSNLVATTVTAFYKIPVGGTYTVLVDKNSCASATSANFNAVITGIKNNKLDVSFSIVPNPNNGDFEIRMYSTTNKKYSLSLYNVTGQVILRDEMNVRTGSNIKKVNLNGIEKGAYILSITGDSGVATQNIIVQ